MPTAKSISFRSHLQSNVMDLIRELNWECARTSKLITGIVSLLAAYTEEGVAMSPSVFICNSISHLLQRAGTGESVPLSNELPFDDKLPSRLLKAAAPLCQDNWRIYVERLPDGLNCRFGVFCGSSDPSSMSVDEVVLDGLPSEFPIVRIAQSAINKVEVRTSLGNRIEFRFNDDVDVHALNGEEHIEGLARAIAEDPTATDAAFNIFLKRLLFSAIKNSHGTLVAVVPTGKPLPDSLQDVVRINPPIDLLERFRLHVDEGKTANTVGRLQTAFELVTGFIGSDGITIFDTSGKVLGYRAFIRSDAADAPAEGGARTRAFTSLCQLTDGTLKAAFFRSQDGRTDFYQN